MIAGSKPQAEARPPRRKRPRAQLPDVAGGGGVDFETETNEKARKHTANLVQVGSRKRSRGWPAALATRAAVLCKVR